MIKVIGESEGKLVQSSPVATSSESPGVSSWLPNSVDTLASPDLIKLLLHGHG